MVQRFRSRSRTTRNVVVQNGPNGNVTITATNFQSDENGEISNYESVSRELTPNNEIQITFNDNVKEDDNRQYSQLLEQELMGTSSAVKSENDLKELSDSFSKGCYVSNNSNSWLKEEHSQKEEKKEEFRCRERSKSRGRSQSDGTQSVSKWVQRERSRSKYRKN